MSYLLHIRGPGSPGTDLMCRPLSGRRNNLINVTNLNKNNTKHYMPDTVISVLPVSIYLIHTIGSQKKESIYFSVPKT
jgi:hypothetical protein